MMVYMCQVPVAPIRASASHRGEQITQMLFGEACEKREASGDFTKVKMTNDGYEGWCQTNQLIETEEPINNANIANKWVNTILVNNQIMKVPIGSSLAFFKNGSLKLAKQHFEYHGKSINTLENPFSKKALHKLALSFANTPYLWGGRSVFGIDCSGFTQLIYKFFNVRLLRDAYQQATQGEEITLSKAMAGDLAFFENEQDKITHVGIILEADIIIHASGKVRIDTINEKGIISSDTGQLTHQLKVVRRMI